MDDCSFIIDDYWLLLMIIIDDYDDCSFIIHDYLLL